MNNDYCPLLFYWTISLIMCDYLPLHQLQRFYTSTRRLVSSMGVSTLTLWIFFLIEFSNLSYLFLCFVSNFTLNLNNII